jgi:RND superfamily putative drug exporter
MTELSLRRPRMTIAAWLVIVAVLGTIGIGVEDSLTQTSLEISGSESARGDELQERAFGNSIPVAVLLQGPPRELDRQGPALVRELRSIDGVRTLSPWDRGSSLDRLRPRPGASLVIADFDRPDGEATDVVVPQAQGAVQDVIESPVEARLSGYAVIGDGFEDASIDATKRAELIAAPVLLLVLLFVFRSPIAAAIPLAIGGATVIAGRGLITLITELIEVDALAVSVASMMALALGVDYALLLVFRFREELDRHADAARSAARTTAHTAGRTIAFAGATLAVVMGVALVMAPGELLISVAAAVAAVVAFSAAIAVSAGPAILAVTGASLDRWKIGRGRGRAGVSGWLRRALREPVIATIAVLGLLLVLAVPAAGLDTGALSVEQLPDDNRVRTDFEAIEKEVGPGWPAPFVVVATADEGPVTGPMRLNALKRWQREVTRFASVEAVVGPGQVATRLRPLTRVSERLRGSDRQLARAERGFERLDDGLRSAFAGLGELRTGLLSASAGAAGLAAGNDRARAGALSLAVGLDQATAGAGDAAIALRAFEDGTGRIAAGASNAARAASDLRSGIVTALERITRRIAPGASRLEHGLREASREVGRLREPAQVADAELAKALRALEAMTMGKADPRYPEAIESVSRAAAAVSGRDPASGAVVRPGYEGLDAALAAAVDRLDLAARGAGDLADGLGKLADGLDRGRAAAHGLVRGLERLASGTQRLARVPKRLLAGTEELAARLDSLSAGAFRLAAGLGQLSGAGTVLEAGLEHGYRRSQPLETGLARADDRLPRYQAELTSFNRRLTRLENRSPDLFKSGYFVLAGIEGAGKSESHRASGAVNVERGGGAARFLVVPEVAPHTKAGLALRDRLDAKSDQLAGDLGGDAAVTGGAAQIADFDRITARQMPLLVLGIAVATYLTLIVVLRALLLPLIAVLLNLFTVAAAFGVLTFLYQVLPGAPLGGPGYIEAVSAAGIFGIVFGLSIDYGVFLLTRIREGYLASGGDGDAAIEYGLERTARVITGAAAIMGAVFLAFASADVVSIRQFGLGLAIAVLLDATVVRLLLLPALMRLCGGATWWLPRWLDSLLPDLDPKPSAGTG